MNNKKTYGIFLAVQTERKYHMSPKKLLKKLLWSDLCQDKITPIFQKYSVLDWWHTGTSKQIYRQLTTLWFVDWLPKVNGPSNRFCKSACRGSIAFFAQSSSRLDSCTAIALRVFPQITRPVSLFTKLLYIINPLSF